MLDRQELPQEPARDASACGTRRASSTALRGGPRRGLELAPTPWLRAAPAAFAEDVNGLGPVLDVGCGPGTVSAHLAGLGVEVCGVDLSPRMIAHARRLHPGLRFSVASATERRLADASLGGDLGWWSPFNLPRDVLPGVPVTWTTRLWQPEQPTVLFAEAGLEPVAKLRLSADPSGRARVLLATRRPS